MISLEPTFLRTHVASIDVNALAYCPTIVPQGYDLTLGDQPCGSYAFIYIRKVNHKLSGRRYSL